MAIQLSNVKEIVSLLSSVRQLGEDWYKASHTVDKFKSDAEKLERELEHWYERARRHGLLSDRALCDSINDARDQLKREEVRLEKLERGCGRVCLCWLSSGTDFPTQLGTSIVNLNDRILGTWKSDRDADDEAWKQAKLLARAPQFRFKRNRRYVRHHKIEEKVKSLLNEEATGENAARFVLLHGRSGSGKSSMARHLALEYKDVADGISTSQENGLGSNCAKRCGDRKFHNVIYLECGPDVNSEKNKVELQLLRNLEWKRFSGTGDTADKDPSRSEVGRASNAGKTTSQDLEEIEANPVPILRQLLKDSQTLIIIDDVFDEKTLQNMEEVCGKQTKILVTSQGSSIGECLIGKLETVHMDPMEPKESLRIIKLHTGFDDDDVINPGVQDGRPSSYGSSKASWHASVYSDPFKIQIAVQERMGDLAEKGHGHPHSLVSLSAGIIQRYRTEVRQWDGVISDYKNRLDRSLSKVKTPLQGVAYNPSVTGAIEIKISRLGEEAKKLLVWMVMIGSQWRSENLLWLFYIEMISKGIPEDGNSSSKFAEVKEELENSNCIQIRKHAYDNAELDWFIHALDEEFIQTKMTNNVDQMREAVENLPDKQQGLKTEPQMQVGKILAALVFKDAGGLGEYNLNRYFWGLTSLIGVLARSVEISQRSVHGNRGETSQKADYEHWSKTCKNSSYQVLLSLAIDEEIHNTAVLNLLKSPMSEEVWSWIYFLISTYKKTVWNISQGVIVGILRIYGTLELVGNNPQYVRLNCEQIRVLRVFTGLDNYQVTSVVLQMGEIMVGLFRNFAFPDSICSRREKRLSSKLLRDFVRHDSCFNNRMLDYCDEAHGVTRFLEEELSAILLIKSGGGSRTAVIVVMVFLLETLIGLGQCQHAVDILETLRQLCPETCQLMDKALLLYARIQLADWDGLLHDLDFVELFDPLDFSYEFERMGLMMRLKGDFHWEGLDEAVQRRLKRELACSKELKNCNKLVELSEWLLLERGFLKFLHGDTLGATADLDYLTKAEEDSSHGTNHAAYFYHRRGVIRRHLGAFAEAMKDFKKAVGLDTDYGPYAQQLAYVKFLMGDEVGARADLDNVTKTPANDIYYQERGIVKRLMGDLSGALEDLNKAFMLDKHDYEVLKYRGYVKFLLGDHDGAQSDAGKALRWKPHIVNVPGSEYDCFGTSIVEYMGYRL